MTPRHAQDRQRPRSVTIVGGLFVVAGSVGLVYHAGDLMPWHPRSYGLLVVLAVRLLAVVGGVFVLRGQDWARWLLAAWLAYHVLLGAFHSVSEAVAHAVLLVVVAYLLWRAPATAYFRPSAGAAGGD